MAATFGIAIKAVLARQGARVFRAATRDITRDAKGAAVQVDRLSASTKRLGGTFGLIARSAAGFLGSIAALAGIRSTIRTIAEFDEATNRAKVIMELTTEQFKPFKEEFKRLAVQTRFTATEVANFGAELAQAGFRGRDFIDVIKPSLDLAAAGAIELSKAQNIMIGTLSQWGFASSEATRVTNVLTKASFLTAASIDQIAEASRKAALLAKRVGLSFEETTAIAAILTENIRQAARAGTGFRGVMASLLAPSREMQERFIEIGGSAEEFSIITGRLIDVMKGLKESQFGITSTTKLLGRESLIAGLIMEQSGDRMKGLGDLLKNLGSFAEDAAKKFEDTLPGAFRRMISAVTDAQLSLGEGGLLGIMRSTVDFTRDVVLALKGWETGFINSKRSVLGFTEVLKTIAVGGGVFLSLKAGLAIITAAVNLLTLSFAASGVGSLLIAVGLVSAAIFALRKETVLFNGEVATVGDFAVATFTVLKEEIENVLVPMTKLVSNAISLAKIFKNIAVGGPGVGGGTEEKLRSGRPLSIADRIAREAANRRRAREIREQALLDQLGFGPSGVSGIGQDEVINNVNNTTQAIKELTDQQRSLINFTDELSLSMTDAFGSILSGAQNAGQAIRSLIDDLAALIIKQTLLVPLANTISTSLTGLLGGTQAGLNVFAPGSPNPENVFLGGNSQRFGSAATRELTSVGGGAGATAAATITTTAATTAAGITTAAAATAAASLTAGAAAASATSAAVPAVTGAAAAGVTGGAFAAPIAFAKGGIIRGPTLFRDGLAGEAGPEAILPLKRDSSGNLGVAGSEKSITINMTINTPNSDSFRRSSKQIFGDAQRAAVRLA